MTTAKRSEYEELCPLRNQWVDMSLYAKCPFCRREAHTRELRIAIDREEEKKLTAEVREEYIRARLEYIENKPLIKAPRTLKIKTNRRMPALTGHMKLSDAELLLWVKETAINTLANNINHSLSYDSNKGTQERYTKLSKRIMEL